MIENKPATFFEHVEAVAGLTIFTVSSGSLIAGSIWTVHRALTHPDTPTQLGLFIPVAVIMGIAMIASCIFLLRACVNA